jgi:broad specificity phosphatase PhoE
MSPDVPLFGRPFYFLRHGESESNRLKTVAGSIDVELTDIGRGQARAAIEQVRPLGVTHVASSHLRRARETAAIIAGALALPHVVIPELAERNWGDLEGKPLAQRVRNAPLPPGAETAEEFLVRVRGGLARVRADGVPLVVAHSGTHRVLCRLLGLPESADAISNCCPVRFSPPVGAGGAWSCDVIWRGMG